MEFDMSIPDPANFISQPIIAWSFQYDPTGSIAVLADMVVTTDPSARAGRITSTSPTFDIMFSSSAFSEAHNTGLLQRTGTSLCLQLDPPPLLRFAAGHPAPTSITVAYGSSAPHHQAFRNRRLSLCLRSV